MSDEKTFLEKIPLVGDVVDIIFGRPELPEDQTGKKAESAARAKAYKETDMRSTSPEVTLTSSGVTSRSTTGSLNLQTTSEFRNAGFSQGTIDAFNSILASDNRSINQQMQVVSRRVPFKRQTGPTIKTGFMGSGPGLPAPITYKDKDKEGTA